MIEIADFFDLCTTWSLAAYSLLMTTKQLVHIKNHVAYLAITKQRKIDEIYNQREIQTFYKIKTNKKFFTINHDKLEFK